MLLTFSLVSVCMFHKLIVGAIDTEHERPAKYDYNKCKYAEKD